ncbi:GNAT family N-acetyltransferase [Sphingomonas sp. LR55]|uniref:GNAT family N-acetyltransferase n=1 Tax=Sphingomonas sp. LR55 TaxID=3050231 RepID=UPI002FE21EC8
MNFTHRVAVAADIPAISALMARAISALQRDFLTPAQVEASRAVMGLDTQLIADGTYLLVEVEGRLAGCGGWSRRATLYGGDHSTALRDAALLDPARDAARIRAMYTDPDFTRQGVGRLVLSVCEAAARDARFARAEMMATLAGEPLYRACGYLPIERIETSGDVPVPMIRMGKDLGRT